jgi:hypothetical protein
MSLANLIRKRSAGKVATAIAAIPATHPKTEPPSVAGIAPVAVANPKGRHSATLAANDGAGLTASTANAWRLHFADGSIREITFSPARDAAEVRRSYPRCRALIELSSTIPACALCQRVTKFGNCGEPVEAGLTDLFCLVAHPAAGADCKHYLPKTFGDLPEGFEPW